jgi:hypothetical protein
VAVAVVLELVILEAQEVDTLEVLQMQEPLQLLDKEILVEIAVLVQFVQAAVVVEKVLQVVSLIA